MAVERVKVKAQEDEVRELKPWVRVLDAMTRGKLSREFREAAVNDSAESESQFTRLTSKQRDLLPIQYRKMVEMAFYLWQRNPIAKRIIQIIRDFTTGEDFKVAVNIIRTAEDGTKTDTKRTDGQRIWDRFVEDPVNRFDSRVGDFVQDLLINGELLLPVAVNTVNGAVRLGYIDSTLVSSVVLKVGALDPSAVVYSDGAADKTMKIISVDPSAGGKLVGEAFFFQINKMMNQSRGHSEIMQLLDWIDALDQFLFNTLEGAALRNAFFYWLKLDGKSEAQIKRMKIVSPHPATVKVTNEKATWEAIAPKLAATDTDQTIRTFKNFILGGEGFPEHWFGEGGNVNKATAAEMGTPTMRMLKAKQKQTKDMVKTIVMFVLQCAVDQKQDSITMAADEKFEVVITAFDFERADASIIGAAFMQIVTALVAAKGEGWIDDETAKQVVDGQLQALGIEVSDKTVEEIQAEKEANAPPAPPPPRNPFGGLPDPNQYLNPGKGAGAPQ